MKEEQTTTPHKIAFSSFSSFLNLFSHSKVCLAYLLPDSAMEFVTAVLGTLIADACPRLCGYVYSKIRNSFRFQLNFNDLENHMNLLTELRSQVENELDESVWTTQVRGWLLEVQGIEGEVNSMNGSIAARKQNCCGGILNRCMRGGELAERLKKVQRIHSVGMSMVAANRRERPAEHIPDLMTEDQTTEVEHIPGPSVEDQATAVGHILRPSIEYQTTAVEHIPAPSIEDQTTASLILAKLMNLLNDDEVGRIGVWGMGGVGKTTLVKNLNNKLRNDSSTQPFGIVIWITVSKQLDLARIQTQIAQRVNMGVNMNESTESVASKLHQRLEQQNKFLLILDDVWEEIALDALGVPRPEVHGGCKIILTTRFFDVCRDMKTDAVLKMDVLNDVEAWELFCQNAGTVATLEHIKPLAKEVARECGGLPLAIIVMGTSMREKKMVELWKDALSELQNSVPYNIKGIEDKVYKPLKWSYDSLGNNIKSCFLYCSLYPEDFSIEIRELVQCWLAEGLIDKQKNYDDIHNRGAAVVEYLKDCCLLEDGHLKDTVKMHDVIRDVAIWIATSVEVKYKSLVRSGISLSQISEGELSRSVRRVSFMFNRIKELPDGVPLCSKASTLLLQDNLLLQSVPQGFLIAFQALKVLNMGGTQIRRLPDSICLLHQLEALLLRDCSHLQEMPPLDGLQKLLVLDCCATRIKELPKEMERLSNLRELNLSCTQYLERVQAGVMSELSGLEVLDMTDSSYRWSLKGRAEKGKAVFEELGCLEKLISVSIGLNGIPFPVKKHTWIQKLKRSQFLMGPTDCEIDKTTEFNERLVIFISLNYLSEEWDILWWLTNATSLALISCLGLDKMVETLAMKSVRCFGCLKSLTISHAQITFGPEEAWGARNDLLPNMEELKLKHVHELKSISELVARLGLKLSKLRVLKVFDCYSLDYLFSCIDFSQTPNLENLEEIGLSCLYLDDLFVYGSRQTSVPSPVAPNLRRIYLDGVQNLKTLGRPKELWQNLETLVASECKSLKKLPLNSQSANTLKEIKGELWWWNQLEWDDDDTRSSLQPFFNERGAP